MIFFTVLLVFTLVFEKCFSDSFVQNAHIYPSNKKDGTSLSFLDNADWSDIESILDQEGFLTVGLLCFEGM